jgi:F0F1-type ATP synthase membrane subunit b/b'
LAQADNFTVKGSEKTAEIAINESRKRYATIVEEAKEQTKEPKEKVVVKKAEKAEAKPVKPQTNKPKDTKQNSKKTGGSLLPRRE